MSAAYDPTEFVNLYEAIDFQEAIQSCELPGHMVDNLKNKFLEYIELGFTPSKAVRRIREDHFGLKLTRALVYAWRNEDEAFKRRWSQAYAESTELIEDKMTELALEGNAAMITQSLKARHPQRYAMTKQEVSGPGGAPIETKTQFDLSNLTSEQRDALRAVLENGGGDVI